MSDTESNRLKEIEELISSLNAERFTITEKIAECKSKLFISENNLNKSDVQRYDDEGMIWWNDVFEFLKWVNKNSKKEYFCWNGLVYKVSLGFQAGVSFCRYEDL